jgi:hypothetical protein
MGLVEFVICSVFTDLNLQQDILHWCLIMYMHFLISPCAQVKAEFLSADGKVISKSSQPCMLKFKSVHMHFVETFLQSASLLSGYH